MQITFERGSVKQVSVELLALSKTLRQAGFELGDIRRTLRMETELEVCQRDLKRQEENAFLSTAHLVGLSSALAEIAQLYERAETGNAERLEGVSGFYRPSASGTLYQNGTDTSARIERLLSR